MTGDSRTYISCTNDDNDDYNKSQSGLIHHPWSGPGVGRLLLQVAIHHPKTREEDDHCIVVDDHCIVVDDEAEKEGDDSINIIRGITILSSCKY